MASPRRKTIDPSQQQVGRLYAKALLAASEKAKATDQVAADFEALVVEVLDRHPKLEAILAAGVIDPQEKVGILDRVFAGRISPLLLNFLKVVAQHNRLDAMRAIHRSIQDAQDELRGRIAVEVRSPGPLGRRVADDLVERLTRTMGGQPRLVLEEDPELVGGLVMRIGDTVFDGSLATQLRRLRNQMINRSIYEIQSRRDRFGNSSGD
jgi:F-type H+-transporting ATPase subunit delta